MGMASPRRFVRPDIVRPFLREINASLSAVGHIARLFGIADCVGCFQPPEPPRHHGCQTWIPVRGLNMSISEFCHRDVVCATRDTTVTEAANLMRRHHVGDVIIVETRGGKQVPVGIVTDRDIVVEVIAAAIDPGALKLGDLRLAPLVTVDEGTSYAATVARMSAEGVRRMPVVSDDGA